MTVRFIDVTVEDLEKAIVEVENNPLETEFGRKPHGEICLLAQSARHTFSRKSRLDVGWSYMHVDGKPYSISLKGKQLIDLFDAKRYEELCAILPMRIQVTG